MTATLEKPGPAWTKATAGTATATAAGTETKGTPAAEGAQATVVVV
jgi:hypothetical protein